MPVHDRYFCKNLVCWKPMWYFQRSGYCYVTNTNGPRLFTTSHLELIHTEVGAEMWELITENHSTTQS